MIATLPYIHEQFDKYNLLIFEGKLKPLEIRLCKAESFYGKLQYRRLYSLFGRIKGYDSFVMKISVSKDLSPEELDDVIIHEMIHYYILSSGLRDKSAHGPLFRKMMADINARFDRHITISHKRTAEELRSDTRIRKHIVCVSRMPDDSLGVTVCAQSKAEAILRSLPLVYRIKDRQLYVSYNPYFNRFPSSRTPKIYKADREQLAKALEDATPIKDLSSLHHQ